MPQSPNVRYLGTPLKDEKAPPVGENDPFPPPRGGGSTRGATTLVSPSNSSYSFSSAKIDS